MRCSPRWPLTLPAIIATLASEITEDHEKDDPNVVKAVIAGSPGAGLGRALYFTRATAPHGEGPLFHHVGVYAYRRDALANLSLLNRLVLSSASAWNSSARWNSGFVSIAPSSPVRRQTVWIRRRIWNRPAGNTQPSKSALPPAPFASEAWGPAEQMRCVFRGRRQGGASETSSGFSAE